MSMQVLKLKHMNLSSPLAVNTIMEFITSNLHVNILDISHACLKPCHLMQIANCLKENP